MDAEQPDSTDPSKASPRKKSGGRRRRGSAKTKSKSNAALPTLADQADRHVLYEQSVQCPEAEIDFVESTFRKLTGRRARVLREDFCGTGNTTCEWVRRRQTHRGYGVDIDPEPLDWGRTHHVASLKPGAQKRVALIEGDVRSATTELAPDIVLAMNFSYWIFDRREVMRAYFEHVRSQLAEGGVFFLDCYGGYDAYREIEERTEHDDFTYVWDQEYYNPVDGACRCAIHFEFPDGSRLDRAFTYSWRLWTLPEVRELLTEAGFSEVVVYWQGWDASGEEGDGVFVPTIEADADAGWICYISARNQGT